MSVCLSVSCSDTLLAFGATGFRGMQCAADSQPPVVPTKDSISSRTVRCRDSRRMGENAASECHRSDMCKTSLLATLSPVELTNTTCVFKTYINQNGALLFYAVYNEASNCSRTYQSITCFTIWPVKRAMNHYNFTIT
jgi:hypothetical protein